MRNMGWVVSGLLLGCGEHADNVVIDAAAGDSITIDGVVVPTRTISGTSMKRHLGDAVSVPVDLSAGVFAAHTLPAFTVVPGTGAVNGTFTIPNVPVGPYLLQVGNTYIERSSDTVDLTEELLGRSTTQQAVAPTHVSLTLGSLASWQATDMLQLISSEAGLVGIRVAQEATSNAPTVGATSLTNLTWDIRNADRPALVTSSAGDTLMLTQLGTFNNMTEIYRTVVRSYQPTGVTMTNGATSSISGTFETVNLAATLNLSWNRIAFNTAIRATSTADETSTYSLLGLHALPDAATHGVYGDSADIMVFAPGYSPAFHTFTTGGWSIGDPYPSSWTRCVTALFMTYRYLNPPSSQPFAVFAQVAVESEVPIAGTTIRPTLGPVGSPTVAGLPAMTENLTTAISTQPTIEWQPPALGTPSYYEVTVVHVGIVPGQAPTRTVTASLVTTSTRTTVPPGLLTAGEIYYFIIEAESTNGWTTASPTLLGLPTGFASITSSLFRA